MLTLAEINTQRYEAVLRISEALSGCQKPEELARFLAEQLGQVLPFEHLDVIVLKENSTEIEWHAWGKGPVPVPDLPVAKLLAWHVYNSQEPLHITDWSTDERVPEELKHVAETIGMKIGSFLLVPLTTPHRRLGTLGIVGARGVTYSTDDVGFLRMIARVVAFAIDDGLNLRRALAAQASVQQQNERLQLLLNLSNRLTSNLQLRELLRTIAANIRDVMRCDAVAVNIVDPASGNSTLYALDFPHGKGLIVEGLPAKSRLIRQVIETLRPLIVDEIHPDEVPPEVYDIVVAEGVKSHCFIPLVNHSRAVGVLVVIRTTDDSFTPEDVEFLSQMSGQFAIAVENALAYRQISELKDKLTQEKLYLEEEIRSSLNFEQIIGNSPALKHVLKLVETVAPSDSTVLVLGETGTGKELIARAIHDHSRRKARTFVKLNCVAIPTGLLESELFGHEKGAFTGAIERRKSDGWNSLIRARYFWMKSGTFQLKSSRSCFVPCRSANLSGSAARIREK